MGGLKKVCLPSIFLIRRCRVWSRSFMASRPRRHCKQENAGVSPSPIFKPVAPWLANSTSTELVAALRAIRPRETLLA